MNRCSSHRRAASPWGSRAWVLAAALGVASVVATAQAQQLCGGATYPFPYTDVSTVAAPFCPGIMEAYVTGISKGTTPTTFGPNNDVTRVQMTTFLQRTVDQTLTRANRRAALNQWWAPQSTNAAQIISLGGNAQFCAADGDTIWATNYGAVLQIQASTGAILGTWTGANNSSGVIVVGGKVYVGGDTMTPAPPYTSSLYVIDPTKPPGPVTVASTSLGFGPLGMAFDGTHLWTANNGISVSIITLPTYTVNTVTTGFTDVRGILFDGSHIWVTDAEQNQLLKLDSSGAILQTISTGIFPEYPAFDGTNIWVPNYTDSTVTVVQASTGNVVTTINPDGINLLNNPQAASFDGERMLITNYNDSTVTVFKAADLSVIGNFPLGGGGHPGFVCNDGVNFWIPLSAAGNLARF